MEDELDYGRGVSPKRPGTDASARRPYLKLLPLPRRSADPTSVKHDS